MDRSFLSRPPVIAASRNFVCVRLTTYEDADEHSFMKKLFVGRSGEVENTTFALLGPDGRQPLSRVGRSARQLFADADTMAAEMNRVAARYADKPAVGTTGALPTVPTVRLALNVAASDRLPLVILYATTPAGLEATERRVRPLAWSEQLIGRFTYATCTDAKELAPLGTAPAPGILVIEPDVFGQKGKVVVRVAPDATADALAKTLGTVAGQVAAGVRSFQSHVRDGRRAGVFWETKLPVTDPMEARARERGRTAGPKPE